MEKRKILKNYEQKIIDFIAGGMPILKCWMNYFDESKFSIDIGANAGFISYYMSKYSKSVYSFEPNPILYKELNELSDIIQTIIPYKSAISNTNGKQNFYVPYDKALNDNNTGLGTLEKTWLDRMDVAYPNRFSDLTEFVVDVQRLDEFKLTNIGVIKIDVEGMEEAVLEGAKNTIRHEKPTMLIELWHEDLNTLQEKLEYIEKTYNYDGFFYSTIGLMPISNTDTIGKDYLFLPK